MAKRKPKGIPPAEILHETVTEVTASMTESAGAIIMVLDRNTEMVDFLMAWDSMPRTQVAAPPLTLRSAKDIRSLPTSRRLDVLWSVLGQDPDHLINQLALRLTASATDYLPSVTSRTRKLFTWAKGQQFIFPDGTALEPVIKAARRLRATYFDEDHNMRQLRQDLKAALAANKKKDIIIAQLRKELAKFKGGSTN